MYGMNSYVESNKSDLFEETFAYPQSERDRLARLLLLREAFI